MNGDSVLTVLATIVGLSGGAPHIDRGLLDGLEPGDRGVAFYSLTVGGERKRIEVGAVEIETVGERSATLLRFAADELREGYSVEFVVPGRRLAPGAVLAGAGRHLEASALDGFVGQWLNDVVAADPAVEERLLAQLVARSERRDREASTLPAVPALRPAPPAAPPAALGAGTAAPATMVRIAGGSYSIGVPLAEAKFYNQHPRFDVRLEAFWIDQQPVKAIRFREFRPDYQVPPEAGGDVALGVTYEEAERFCRFHDKRLPNEFEWEVAAQAGEVSLGAGILEWTSSWYLPYPGNAVPEPEYGAGLKVLRSAPPAEVRARSFLEPGVRQSVVGFRCAVGELESVAR